MKKEMEYYLGYLRNPYDKLKDGFDEVKEYEVILYKNNDNYYEVITNEKVFVDNGHHVFDGHRVTEAEAGLIGRIGEKLELKETLDRMNTIRTNNMAEYVEIIYKLIHDTKEKAMIGEQEYQEEVEKFINTFRK